MRWTVIGISLYSRFKHPETTRLGKPRKGFVARGGSPLSPAIALVLCLPAELDPQKNCWSARQDLRAALAAASSNNRARLQLLAEEDALVKVYQAVIHPNPTPRQLADILRRMEDCADRMAVNASRAKELAAEVKGKAAALTKAREALESRKRWYATPPRSSSAPRRPSQHDRSAAGCKRSAPRITSEGM